jgi:amino acid adenylation domain-containing protein
MTDLTNRIASLSPEKRQILLQRLQQKTPVASSQIPPQSRDSNIFPVSFAQQRLWFVDQMQPGNPFYNIPVAVRLQGELNIPALEYSFNQLIQRHEALRTTFTTIEGKPVQAIAPSMQLTLPVVDLRSFDPATQQQTVHHLATQEAQRPFDLTQAPLLRVSLLQLSKTQYVMLFTLHHIISDIWSTGILVEEIATLYTAYCEGKSISLPELPIQYADFAVWQRQWLQGEALATQLSYWKQQLANLTMLQLPSDRSRPAVESFRGAKQSFVIPKALTEALKALSQQEGVTLFMTLLAAFQVLLQRYTSQDDISVGSAIANRNRREIEGIIGFFVNTLVLRTDLSGNPSFKQLLNRVKEVTIDAYSHQDLPFEKLVEELHPERNLSYNPLFQVAFQLQNTPMPAMELPNLTLSVLEVDNYTTKVDLHLSLMETEEGLNGAFEYSTDLFNAATIARMLAHFQNLLAGIITNPDQQISSLPLLTPAEQHQLLVEWNNTQTDYPQDCIHQIIERQAEKTPDGIAVTFGDQQLTYRELNTKANQLAHYLQKLGVKPETLVGICIERSLDMIVAILGILKAGAAYLPLDPAYPAERLAFMLEDAQVSLILTQSHLTSIQSTICLDKESKVINQEPQHNPCSSVTADNLAYVIYTSGSTGKPKGVLLPHRGLCNVVTAQQKLFNVQPSDRLIQFASLNFDASIWEIVLALGHGASLHLASREDLLPGASLVQLMRERAITIATLPPSVLAVLPPEKLPELRTIIVAGEACTPDLVNRWGFGRRFFNAYGPTETTICATVTQCTDNTCKPPIGKPITNTRCFVLDKQMQLVPCRCSWRIVHWRSWCSKRLSQSSRFNC